MMSKTFEASNPNFSEKRIKLIKPKDCRRLFHSACALDRTEIALRLLLTNNCDKLTHFLTLEKEPILSFFARHNVIPGVKYLLDKDAINIVNSTDLNNNTALMAAAKEGNTEILQMLMSAGAKCNMINNKGFMSLHYAAIGGHVECVRRLLGEEDIIVKAVTKYGYSMCY